MERRRLYDVLGVEPTATTTEIRRAFRRLARKLHPDINPGDPEAERRYRAICEAYEILSDPERRARYDRGGEAEEIEGAEAARLEYGFAGFDFSLETSSREEIFGEVFRAPARRPARGPVRGEDIQRSVTISFDESLQGRTAPVPVTRLVACARCEGWGTIPGGTPRPCPSCQGRGRSTRARGVLLFARPCPECEGTGVLRRETCPDCRGAGRSPREETVEVTLPAGVDEGAKIVVPGKGHEGRGGGRPGDLYVLVHVTPHPLFTRKGDNLYCEVPVTFAEAALGAKIEVPTPDGTVRVRLPAGIQTGQQLRVSGRGAPSMRGAGRGDLFVVVRVVTPTIYDERSRELLRELERRHPENPREKLLRRFAAEEEVLR